MSVELLDEKKIPCRTVGKYRRVRFDDLMAYKRKDDEARAKIIDQLTAEAQELRMELAVPAVKPFQCEESLP